MKINLKNNRYLIAVSGGPDSMALLDIVRNKKKYIEVAHVNYHKRDSAINDEKLVRRYCRKYKIKFHLLDVYPDEVKGNFQSYARDKRYEFFSKLVKKNKLDGVLIAHHKDDHIETYLMQKEKNIGVNHYGLNIETIIKDIKVIRPLLDYDKKQLIDYCITNNIEYGIDESNLSDDYTRNRIRHTKVDKMSNSQKNKLVKEIDKENKLKEKEIKIVSKYFDRYEFKLDEFFKIKYLIVFLRHYFPNKADKFYMEMLRQIKESKSYIYHNDDYYIVKEYDLIHIFKKIDDYYYEFNNIKSMNKTYEYFKLSKKGNNIQGVTLNKNDFPVYIRSFRNGDYISMRYGNKKINRFFIDNKIYLKDRLSWPILFNKNDSAILVPGIGCDIHHYSNKHNMFMIKL